MTIVTTILSATLGAAMPTCAVTSSIVTSHASRMWTVHSHPPAAVRASAPMMLYVMETKPMETTVMCQRSV